jgi:hypothetical protein
MKTTRLWLLCSTAALAPGRSSSSSRWMWRSAPQCAGRIPSWIRSPDLGGSSGATSHDNQRRRTVGLLALVQVSRNLALASSSVGAWPCVTTPGTLRTSVIDQNHEARAACWPRRPRRCGRRQPRRRARRNHRRATRRTDNTASTNGALASRMFIPALAIALAASVLPSI